MNVVLGAIGRTRKRRPRRVNSGSNCYPRCVRNRCCTSVLRRTAALQRTVLRRAAIISTVLRRVLVEHILQHRQRLTGISILKLVNLHCRAPFRIGIKFLDHFSDLIHQVAAGADHHRGCALIRHRDHAIAFLDALILIAGRTAAAPAAAAQAAKTATEE